MRCLEDFSIIGIVFLILVSIFCGCESDSNDSENKLDGDVSEDNEKESDMEANDKAENEIDKSGLTWVEIPSGKFKMGCSTGDDTCKDVEKPQHEVTISSFEMTKTEITYEQYVIFLNEHGNDCGEEKCINKESADIQVKETDGKWSVNSGYENFPQAQVSWFGAKEYCKWANGRLPSESEWEYAGRAGTATRYYCGDDPACLDKVAWMWANSDGKTHQVAQKEANDFGLFDMLGNVWEWVEDCYHPDYKDAPVDGSVWQGGDCMYRILRGGSWDEDGGTDFTLRASRRGSFFPAVPDDDGGFRCVR